MAEDFVPPPPSSSTEGPVQVGGVLSVENIPVPQSNLQPLRETPNINVGAGGGATIKKPVKTSVVAQQIKNNLGDKTKFKKVIAPGTDIQTYDATYTGANFDRFYNTPRVFKSIGFSPYRDNDKVYNENMTWWDGFKRSAGQAVEMGSISFKGALPWNAWDGEYSDIQHAEAMKRASSIGQDTRDGFGAGFNNLTLNSGFTFGILAELAAEEAVFAAVGLIPGMQGVAGGGMFSAAAKAIKNFGKFREAVKVSSEAMKAYRSTSTMRQIYKAVKESGFLGKAFLPGTVDAIKDIYRAGAKGKPLTTLAAASRTFGGFYRDARQLGLAISESKLEAAMVEDEIRNKLIDQHYNENGELPSSEQLGSIYSHASDAAKETFLWNLPVVYLSNKIVLDKAMRGFIPTRVLRAQAGESLGGKFVRDAKWLKNPKAWQFMQSSTPLAAAAKLFKPKQWNVKNLTKDFLGSMLMYTKANMSEGLQELYQEAVSPTMIEYYTNKYNNPYTWASKSMWGEFGEQSKRLVGSKEGLQIFASGFLMGGLIQVPQSLIFDYGRDLAWRIRKPEDYDAYKTNQQKRADRVVAALNYITDARPQEWYNPTTKNGAAQLNLDADVNIANNDGDVGGTKDLINDQLGEHIHTLVSTGKIDLLQDQIDDFDSMSNEELIEAWGQPDPSKGDAGSYYRKKIQQLKEDISDIKNAYDTIEETIVNPYDITQITKDTDLEEWTNTFLNHQAIEEYKKLLVLGHYHAGKTLQRMTSINNDFVQDKRFKGIPATELNILFSSDIDTKATVNVQTGKLKAGTLSGEIVQLQSEIDTLGKLEVSTPESKKMLGLKKERLKLLENFAEKLGFYMSTRQDYENARRSNAPDLMDKEEGVEVTMEVLKKAYEDYILFTAESNGLRMEDVETKEYNFSKLSKKGQNIVRAEYKKLQRLYTYTENRKGRPMRKVLDAIEQDMADLMGDNPEVYFQRELEKAKQSGDEKRIKDLEEKLKEVSKKDPKAKVETARKLAPGFDEAFEKLMDFYKLTNDRKEIVEAINVLHNPHVLAMQSKVMADVMKANYANKQEQLRKMWEIFNSNVQKNDVLSELSKVNIFFDPKYIDQFLQGRMDDIIFYKFDGKNIVAVSELNEAERTKAENDIQRILDEYWRKQGLVPTGKPITGARPESEYNAKAREKLPNDKRTYADLAAQFGFDPTSSRSDVNAKKVLQLIIDSEYSTGPEKMLAKKFLSVVSDLQIVKFVNNLPNPGVYGKTEGIKVDARYSSNDYKGGDTGHPIEFVILHEIGHSLTVEGFDTDANFKSKIINLYKIAVNHHEKSGIPKPLYGLKNEYEFITETLSNPTFQTYLKTIPYQTTNKSLWQEFLAAVEDFLANLLGVSKDTTLFDEAVYVITSKIGSPDTGGPMATTPGGPITPTAPTLPQKKVKLANRNDEIGSAKDQNLGMFFEGLELHYDLESQPEVYKMLVDKLGKDKVDTTLRGKVFALNGQWIFNHGGSRLVMFMHVGNGVVPVYFSSSGTSGKALTWHPFFGIDMNTGWIFKQTYDPIRKLSQLDDMGWGKNDNYKDALPLMNDMLDKLYTDLNLQSFKNEVLKLLPQMDLEGAPKGLFRGQNLELSRDSGGVQITPHANNNISIILTSILKDNILGKTETVAQPTTGAKYVNQFSSIQDLKPLLPQLLQMYTDAEAAKTREKLPNFNQDYQMMTDDQIINSEGFRNFLGTSGPVDLMTKYNEANKTMPKSMLEQMRMTPTPEQRKYLKEKLGYTDEEVNALTYAEAQANINDNVPPGIKKKLEEKLKQEELKADEIARDLFYKEYNDIDPTQEDAREKLFNWYNNVQKPERLARYYRLGIDGTLWNKMFDEKLAQLKAVEPLALGEFYILDGELYQFKVLSGKKYGLLPKDQLALDPSEQKLVYIDMDKLNRRNIKPAPKPKSDTKTPAPVDARSDIERRRDEKIKKLDQEQGYKSQSDQLERIQIQKEYLAELAALEGGKQQTTDAKADIEIITSVEKLKNQNQIFQSPSGKFGVLSAKDNKTIIWSDTLEQAKELVAQGAAPTEPETTYEGQGELTFPEDVITPNEKEIIDNQMPDNAVEGIDINKAHDNASDNPDDLFKPDDPLACM